MSTTAGSLTQVSVTDTTAVLTSGAATGGTAPYTYQWYRSTAGSGFTPGPSNAISGATSLTLNDTGLIPNTTYYYKVVATDSGSVSDTSSALTVQTTATPLEQNAISQVSIVGQVDMRVNPNSISAQVDSSESGTIYAGQAVKIVDSADGIPKVIACTASTDNVLGFVAYSVKDASYVAGDRLEIVLKNSVVYLMPTESVSRGAKVVSVVSTVGGFAAATGATGSCVIGWAFDKATAGSPCRVYLETPSFTLDA